MFTAEFSLETLYHAMYLAFVYSLLAFGASIYRQLLDDFSIQDIKLGEDMYFSYDPLMMLWMLSFVVFAGLFEWIALEWSEPRVELYCVPLMAMINAVQVYYRMSQQRLQIKTLGLVGRDVFEERFRVINYDQIHLVEVLQDPVWNVVMMYYTEHEDDTGKDVKIFRRRMTRRMLPKLVTALENKTTAKIFTSTSKRTPLPPNTDGEQLSGGYHD